MNNLYGYFGKQLRVSLDNKEILKENIDASILRKYLGGAGYAARVLYDEIPQGTNPLSPENKLIFATSPLTANRIPGGGSIMLCFKSPLTNTWGESLKNMPFMEKGLRPQHMIQDQERYLVLPMVRQIGICAISIHWKVWHMTQGKWIGV
jgi:hypothetical protein